MNLPEGTRWTVVGEAPARDGRRYVRAICSCGTERVVQVAHIRSGRSRSCGCLRVETPQKIADQIDRSRLPADWLPDAVTCEWKPAVGCPGYFVSTTGRVFSSVSEPPRELRGSVNRDGYRTIAVSVGAEEKTTLVHRLVLLTFVGPPPAGKPMVRHLDGNPANNDLANLAWGDNSENQRDRVAHGTDPHASRTHCSSGHEYTTTNTRWRAKNGRQSRVCRECARLRARSSR